jgi:hypothetical protein
MSIAYATGGNVEQITTPLPPIQSLPKVRFWFSASIAMILSTIGGYLLTQQVYTSTRKTYTITSLIGENAPVALPLLLVALIFGTIAVLLFLRSRVVTSFSFSFPMAILSTITVMLVGLMFGALANSMVNPSGLNAWSVQNYQASGLDNMEIKEGKFSLANSDGKLVIFKYHSTPTQDKFTYLKTTN